MEFLIFLLGAFVIEVLAGYCGIKFSNEVGTQGSRRGSVGNSKAGQACRFVFAALFNVGHKRLHLSI